MNTLKEILAEQGITTLAAAKAWLSAMGRKLKPYFDDRVIRERTVVSSKLFGWTRGNQILEGLETLAGANAAVARLVRLLRGDGVDVGVADAGEFDVEGHVVRADVTALDGGLGQRGVAAPGGGRGIGGDGLAHRSTFRVET